MKKLIFALVAVAAFTFASCGGNKTKGPEAATDSAIVNNDSLNAETMGVLKALKMQLTSAIDAGKSDQVVTALANMSAIYRTLANAGKLEEVKGYGDVVKAFVNEHNDAITKLIGDNEMGKSILSEIENLPTSQDATLEDAQAAVSDHSVSMASEAFQKGAVKGATAEAAADALKNAAAATGDDLKEKAQDLKEDAKDAAQDLKEKAQDVSQDVKEKAQDVKQDAKEAADKAKEKLGL